MVPQPADGRRDPVGRRPGHGHLAEPRAGAPCPRVNRVARFDGRNPAAFNRTPIAAAVSRSPHCTRSRAVSRGYPWVIPWGRVFGA